MSARRLPDSRSSALAASTTVSMRTLAPSMAKPCPTFLSTSLRSPSSEPSLRGRSEVPTAGTSIPAAASTRRPTRRRRPASERPATPRGSCRARARPRAAARRARSRRARAARRSRSPAPRPRAGPARTVPGRRGPRGREASRPPRRARLEPREPPVRRGRDGACHPPAARIVRALRSGPDERDTRHAGSPSGRDPR